MLLQYDPHLFSTLSKNLGNWRDFFGQMVYRPPWQNISRTPMMAVPQKSASVNFATTTSLTSYHELFF